MDGQVLASWPGARVVRLTLAAGEGLPVHAAPADGLVLCLRGRVHLRRNGRSRDLGPEEGLPLVRGDAHSIHAVEPSVLLLILLG
jgi:quercetin dioxygenase-like cupin family protein